MYKLLGRLAVTTVISLMLLGSGFALGWQTKGRLDQALESITSNPLFLLLRGQGEDLWKGEGDQEDSGR